MARGAARLLSLVLLRGLGSCGGGGGAFGLFSRWLAITAAVGAATIVASVIKLVVRLRSMISSLCSGSGSLSVIRQTSTSGLNP